MAQVYSLNIVGYCNVPVTTGYNYLSNPLDNGNNDANTLFPNVDPTQTASGPWDGSSIQEWNGVKWVVSQFDSLTDDTTTGFTDPSANPVPAPILSSGKGFLLVRAGTSNLVTFVGQVRTGTNIMALPVSAHHYSLGSMLPYAGGISSTLGMLNPNPTQATGPLDGCSIQILKVSATGQALGYSVAQFDSLTDDTTTGFTDPSANAIPEPQIKIGQGFIFDQGSPLGTYNWTQILNP